MKVLAIALILAGLMSGTALAAGKLDWWHKEAKKYRCAGTAQYVICHSVKSGGQTPYRVMIDDKVLWVSFGGKLLLDCAVRGGPERCRYYGPK